MRTKNMALFGALALAIAVPQIGYSRQPTPTVDFIHAPPGTSPKAYAVLTNQREINGTDGQEYVSLLARSHYFSVDPELERNGIEVYFVKVVEGRLSGTQKKTLTSEALAMFRTRTPAGLRLPGAAFLPGDIFLPDVGFLTDYRANWATGSRTAPSAGGSYSQQLPKSGSAATIGRTRPSLQDQLGERAVAISQGASGMLIAAFPAGNGGAPSGGGFFIRYSPTAPAQR